MGCSVVGEMRAGEEFFLYRVQGGQGAWTCAHCGLNVDGSMTSHPPNGGWGGGSAGTRRNVLDFLLSSYVWVGGMRRQPSKLKMTEFPPLQRMRFEFESSENVTIRKVQ